MTNKKIYVIHPKDDSTDFLEEITIYLKENVELEIHLERLTTRDEHSTFFENVSSYSESDLILFFGHGTSNCLSGAITHEYEYPNFISDSQLKIFKSKKVLLLSCRSNEYLRKFFKDCGLQNAIGFPNLITEFDEITHHDDPERYSDSSEEDIELFKKALIEIIKFSLQDYIKYDLTLLQLNSRIKLRTNKRIIKLYNNNPKNGKLPLGKMLNDMVKGLEFF